MISIYDKNAKTPSAASAASPGMPLTADNEDTPRDPGELDDVG